MQVWAALSRRDPISKEVWVDASCGAGKSFSWRNWWRLSHTDPAFCPAECEAAFAIYHFTGMLGVSEAQAESAASLLKRYQPVQSSGRLGTTRVIEKAVLRMSGIAGDGSDDLFLLRCWAQYFGSLQKGTFSVRYKKQHRRKRLPPLGHGSKVVHVHLKRSAAAAKGLWLARARLLQSLPHHKRLGQRKKGALPGGLRWRQGGTTFSDLSTASVIQCNRSHKRWQRLADELWAFSSLRGRQARWEECRQCCGEEKAWHWRCGW